MIMKMKTMRAIRCWTWLGVLALLLQVAGCGSDTDSAGMHAGGHGDGMSGDPSHEKDTAAVPVETQQVVRRSISEYLQTNGTLEAENEVDLVARTTGPITARPSSARAAITESRPSAVTTLSMTPNLRHPSGVGERSKVPTVETSPDGLRPQRGGAGAWFERSSIGSVDQRSAARMVTRSAAPNAKPLSSTVLTR